MENNNTTSTNKCIKPEKSPCSSGQRNMQNIRFMNERFCLTPDSMGLERRSDTPRPCNQHNHIPGADISYERQCIMPTMNTPQMSSNYGCAPATHDTQNMKRENLQQTPYNQTYPIQQPPATNLYSSMNLDSAQQPCSSFKSSPTSTTQQKSCENSRPTQEITQPQSFCYNNKPWSTSPEPKHSRTLSFGYLLNRTRSEQPISSSATLSRCNISLIPSASSTLQCLKSPGSLTSDSPAPTDADIQQCCHPLHSSDQYMSEIPTAHYEQLLQKYKSGNSSDSIRVLNDIFLERLKDIDANAQGDSDLKLITYQEWVELLLNVNDTIVTNMEELESEVAKRLQMIQQKITTNCGHSQGTELMKCRRDIDTLIKFIRNAYQYHNWDLQNFTFETITSDQILGSEETQFETVNASGTGGSQLKAESMHTNKLMANISALAFEVAEKHDEVIQLKQQVTSMEDEVQKAHKKIQLKDDVIKELRNDLKCGHNKQPHRSSLEEGCLDMPPINLESQTSRSANTQLSECNQLMSQDDTGSQFDSLSNTEHEEKQKFKVLEEELNDFFAFNRELNINTKQKMQAQCQRLKDFFKEVETEKGVAYSKLDFIRRQLIDLESSSSEGVNDCDSGFDSKSENDQDAKIVDSVRRRLRKLKETVIELKKRVQKLELENNEISSCLQSEKSFSQLNSETVKQVADLLCELRGKQFSYDIYNTTQAGMNPFCEAIMDMQKEFKDHELQCLHLIGVRNKTVEELTQALINKEKTFSDQQRAHLNIIDLEQLNKTTLPPTIPPPPIPSTCVTATASATFLTGQKQQNTTSLQDLSEK